MNTHNLIQSAHVKHYSAALVMPRHQHRDASLCLVVNGAYAQRTRGRDEVHQVGHIHQLQRFELRLIRLRIFARLVRESRVTGQGEAIRRTPDLIVGWF
jgi:hypothetical protein